VLDHPLRTHATDGRGCNVLLYIASLCIVTLMRGQLLRGHLEALLLACLQEESAHGYELMQRLYRRSSGAFDLPEGTIYPVLRRLEREGHLSSKWEDAQGRRRRIYTLTARGRRRLKAQRAEWDGFVIAIEEVLGR
jgi:DNA-binding PadR family transcriptional regulator